MKRAFFLALVLATMVGAARAEVICTRKNGALMLRTDICRKTETVTNPSDLLRVILPCAQQLMAMLPDGRQVKTLLVSGCNLQVVNGMGTTDTANGAGNIILGYNELDHWNPQSSVYSGSHNLVGGMANGYDSYGGMVFGRFNYLHGEFSTITNGQENTAEGEFTHIAGGWQNYASGEMTVVSGGYKNTAGAYYSAVGGGLLNTADFDNAFVAGGFGNTAGGYCSSVFGGLANQNYGKHSVLVGTNGVSFAGRCQVRSGLGEPPFDNPQCQSEFVPIHDEH